MTAKHRLRLRSALTGRVLFFWAGLALFFIWLEALTSSSMTPTATLSSGKVQFFVIAAVIFLLGFSVQQAQALSGGARVFRQACAPIGLWRRWLAKALTQTTTVWMLLMLACSVLPRGTAAHAVQPWSGSFIAAVFSVVLSLTLLCGVSYQRLLHRGWGVVGFVALAWMGLSGQLMLVVSTLPESILLLTTAVWPMLAAVLWLRWQQPPGVAESTQDDARLPPWLWRRLNRYRLRFTLLLTPATRFTMPWGPHPVLQKFRTVGIGQAILWGIASPALLFVNSGGLHLVFDLSMLAALTVLYTGSLVYQDLSWRTALTPRGMPKGHLGWRIVRSTAIQAMVFLTLTQTTLVVCSVWLPHITMGWGPFRNCNLSFCVGWTEYSELLRTLALLTQVYAVMALKMTFAISLATVLQGVRAWTARGLFALGLLALCWAWKAWPAQVPVFTPGPGYITALLLGTALCITLANRLWTVEKLMRFARA